MQYPGYGIRRWIFQRELGNVSEQRFSRRSIYGLPNQAQVESYLFPQIRCVRSWNPIKTTDNTHHGGIFNFDFSPDGYAYISKR